MPNNIEEFIEEMIKAAKARQDLSVWQNHPETSDVSNLISTLASFPRRRVELPNLANIQGRVLDRIEASKNRDGFWMAIPNIFKIGVAILGSLLIVGSLAMGLSVAALQSVPGQAIYPLKKIVENIQLKFTPEQQVASLQIQFANNRVDELQTVLEQQQQGELTDTQTQAIVSATVKDIQKTTAAAVHSSASQPKSGIVNKLADINNKLKIASIQSGGEVKIEIEKAIQSTQDSQTEAIKNIQDSGGQVNAPPIDNADNKVTASGKLTTVTDSSVSIGTAKFLLTKDTKYINIVADNLKAGLMVTIIGEIKDNKTYADQITLVITPATSGDSTVKTEILNPEVVPLNPTGSAVPR